MSFTPSVLTNHLVVVCCALLLGLAVRHASGAIATAPWTVPATATPAHEHQDGQEIINGSLDVRSLVSAWTIMRVAACILLSVLSATALRMRYVIAPAATEGKDDCALAEDDCASSATEESVAVKRQCAAEDACREDIKNCQKDNIAVVLPKEEDIDFCWDPLNVSEEGDGTDECVSGEKSLERQRERKRFLEIRHGHLSMLANIGLSRIDADASVDIVASNCSTESGELSSDAVDSQTSSETESSGPLRAALAHRGRWSELADDAEEFDEAELVAQDDEARCEQAHPSSAPPSPTLAPREECSPIPSDAQSRSRTNSLPGLGDHTDCAEHRGKFEELPGRHCAQEMPWQTMPYQNGCDESQAQFGCQAAFNMHWQTWAAQHNVQVLQQWHQMQQAQAQNKWWATAGGQGGQRYAGRQSGKSSAAHAADAAGNEPGESGGKDMTLQAIMQCLQAVDPAQVVIVRKIKHLGFNSAKALRRHYSAYGRVERVLVSYSHVQSRVRPASLGFIVMGDVESAESVLAAGSEQVVGNVEITLSPFTRHGPREERE